MANDINNNVETKQVGFAPILLHYFQKCDIANIIDQNVTLDPIRKLLTHWQAIIAMITAIFKVTSLYRVYQFATEPGVLDVIFSDISPNEYFDDRLGDILNVVYQYGIGNLEILTTRKMMEEFNISNFCRSSVILTS